MRVINGYSISGKCVGVFETSICAEVSSYSTTSQMKQRHTERYFCVYMWEWSNLVTVWKEGKESAFIGHIVYFKQWAPLAF